MRATPERQWVDLFAPVGQALALLLAPHGEVAIHDLATERIVALWNPMSGREVGDESLLADLPGDPADMWVAGPYAKSLPDGRTITSVSAVLADADRHRRGLLCINMDRSPLDDIAAIAASMLAARTPRPAALFDKDWREQIPLRVHEFCTDRALRVTHLDRSTRRELVAVLDREGLFALRGAADLAAQSLGVSRATVYSLLKEARR